MTIQRTFFDWARSGLDWDRAPYEQMAPNLLVLNQWLVTNFGGQPLGLDDFDREIRSGGTISDHAYGAALDWRYEPGWLPNTSPRTVPRDQALELVDHIIDWSAELHIDRIHDYVGDRIWTAGRTSNVADAHGSWWKKQNGAGSGMGESWARYFHFATTRDGWADARAIAARGVPLPGAAPSPPPSTGKYTVKAGDSWWSISQRYGITVNQLVAMNPPATSATVIHPGDVLNVPGGSPPLPTPTPPTPQPKSSTVQGVLDMVLLAHESGKDTFWFSPNAGVTRYPVRDMDHVRSLVTIGALDAKTQAKLTLSNWGAASVLSVADLNRLLGPVG